MNSLKIHFVHFLVCIGHLFGSLLRLDKYFFCLIEEIKLSGSISGAGATSGSLSGKQTAA